MSAERAHALMYHGLRAGDRPEQEPFAERRYGVLAADFELHMAAIAEAVTAVPSTCWEIARGTAREGAWAITFDDGMASALGAARIVESRGWRAHFFVVSGWVGRPGYLTACDLQDLQARGHIIGSHSVSHPHRMSGLSYEEMVQEWRGSSLALREMLGESARVASVPGGSVSRKVVEAARQTGIAVLFTSEPVSRVRWSRGCAIVGRYTVHSDSAPSMVAALAEGRLLACGTQWVGWNSRKAVRRALGGSYYPVRDHVVRLFSSS